jgi:hypothetical protein
MMRELYEKYKATDYQNLAEINPLSFILRKAELGLDLTASEWDWLEQHQQTEIQKIIKNQENYRAGLRNEVHKELLQLKKNRFVYYSFTTMPTISSAMTFTLYKVHAQERLTDSELPFVGTGYHEFLNFIDKKQKYGITEDIPYDSIALNILEKLEKPILLSAADIEWLCTHNAHSFLTPLQNQFSRLQNKYKATGKGTNSYNPLMLCHILQKLDENTLLDEMEVKFLKAEGLTDTLKIVQKMEFSALKVKYHATQIQEDDISHHLFKVLKKLDTGLSLPEPDINYLKKRKLFETVKFVYKKEADSLNRKIEQGHGLRPDDITWCEEHDFKDIIFKWLKNDYGVNYRPDTPDSCLYIILRKLESSNRLTDEEVVWLEGENLLRPEKEIYLAHHTLEARFYENEFQRTKGHWSLVNASAHWRKAEKPQQALKQTNNLNFKQIKPAKLAAALLTTRGGALRDIDHLSEAEQCALEAIKYFPNSHNPYTLMGALCYDTGRYDEGDRWFEEAVKRGAKPQDQDAEIKRILHKKKESECKELISHLLKKDSSRFAWLRTWKVGKR